MFTRPDSLGLLASCCLCCGDTKDDLNNLEVQMKELTNQATEKHNHIEQLKISQWRKNIERESLNKWLEDTRRIDLEVKNFVEKYKDHKKCTCGLLPNYWFWWKVRGQILAKSEEVLELQNKGDNMFNDIEKIFNQHPVKGQIIPVKMTIFDSTNDYINTILKYLKDESVGSIGVHGMGGIGKTTLLKVVNNQLLRENIGFDYVHWVSVSKDFDLYMLQNAIASSIGLQYTDEDEDIVRRAAKLHSALIVKARVVLILDNMWRAFSLEHIGIPNVCKIIITTRVFKVCRWMKTDKNVKINKLKEDEAWAMFKDIVGIDNVSGEPEKAQRIMIDVANECDGLPLAIDVVAKAISDKNINHYQLTNDLEDLRCHDDNIITRDGKVLSALRLSYEMLTDNRTRSCFLYCALYPEGHLIESKELIEYWTWEGILGDREMLEDYMRKGEKALFNIADASLLETTCDKNGNITFVKMHGMVRYMAKSMSPRCLIEAGVRLIKPQFEERWTNDVECISLMRNDLKELPPSPKCPKLSTLLLQHNSFSETISPNFFTHMISLKVLDLSFTGIDSLPNSLSAVVSLEALLLRNCWNLVTLPSLACLLKLRVLDLSFTHITKLPPGMEKLTNLRSINLSHTGINDCLWGLFNKYTRLEHLLMEGWDLIWGSDATCELERAYNLRVLHSTFKDMQVFTIFVTLAECLQLYSFRLCVGQQIQGCNISSSTGKSVIISGCKLGDNHISLPPLTTELCIMGCFSDRPAILSIHNSQHVQNFTINQCQEISSIRIDEGDTYMPSLEKMDLKRMDNLMVLFHGNLQHGTLESLEILHMSNCNKIKVLLEHDWLEHLINLREINVEDCDSMEKIISGVELDTQQIPSNIGTVKHRELYKLHFSNLKSLKRIFNGILDCQSFFSIEVSGCPKLDRLPSFNPAPRALIDIKGEREWWERLNWDHALAGTKDHFQTIFVEVDKEHQAESSS